MTLRWLPGLPQRPLLSGASVSPIETNARASADIGQGQARPRALRQGDVVGWTFKMWPTQFDLFEDWYWDYEYGLAGGVLPYWWIDPERDLDRRWRFLRHYDYALDADTNYLVRTQLIRFPLVTP